MKLHIFVATTQGLVAIQNITTIDDADISSIVSINGTSTTANISSAYHNFVKKGAGVIQQDFGACSYRVNIAQRIDHGNSWQLAFYLAHAAQSKQLLGNGQVCAGDQVICATGEINTTSREIHRVEEVSLKQRLAAEQIQQWQKMNVKTSFLVPESNAQDIDKRLKLITKQVYSLEQALSFLPVHALINTAAVKPKTTRFKPIFISIIIFSVFILSLYALFSSQSELSTELSKETAKNVVNKIPAQKTWQVVVLTKPLHGINHRLQLAYTQIEKTISEQLIAENFEVTDKALLIGGNNINEQALFALNKQAINVAIRFNFNVNQLHGKSINTWRYELSAFLIDLESKKQVETHNEYGKFTNDLINCGQQCQSLWFADNARKLAQDMGAILVVKLQNLPRRYQFQLSFEKFLTEELSLIHKQLKVLNGFISVDLLSRIT